MPEQTFNVTRVGAEPVVVWDRDEESDLPRFTLMLPGWEFRGPGKSWLSFGDGAAVSATVVYVNDEPLVPSDPEPDIENGIVHIGVVNNNDRGYTIADLRAIARSETRWRRFRRWLERRMKPLPAREGRP